ncbi:MAG: DNA/RNA non-specific endonuclease [Clostridia bacterium]|nr:DNA/RNA non-specific endonuclease [Clostridia bacterium]
MKRKVIALVTVLFLVFSLIGCEQGPAETTPTILPTQSPGQTQTGSIPAYQSSPYIQLNDNVPAFPVSQYTVVSFETYGELDDLGRCTEAMACIGIDLMPTEDRGSIGQVKPSGWQTIRYDIVDGGYLYNRCHLIGFQLSGENANEQNLITGTRYMNTKGMLPFENMVADYVKETENHVLYRVTPIFEGSELVARGVQIEALSMEDKGAGICFNVYVYNVQPGIIIDYATGHSRLDGTAATEALTSAPSPSAGSVIYILNTNTGKFHLPSCGHAGSIKEENRLEITGQTRDQMIDHGYSPCGTCKP